MKIRSRAAFGATALVLSLSACSVSTSSSIDADALSDQVSDTVAEQVGQSPDDVSCPDDLEAKVDATTTCVLTVGEDTIDATVTVTSVKDGTASFDVQVADQVN